MPDLDIQANIGLAPYTTMKIGGRARFFVEALSERDVVEALQFASDRGLDVFVLGGGSNVVISDEGFDGLVLHIAMQGIVTEERTDQVMLSVQAGEEWDRFLMAGPLALAACSDGAKASAPASATPARPTLLLGPEDVLVVGTSDGPSGPLLTGTLQPERRADLRAVLGAVVTAVLR